MRGFNPKALRTHRRAFLQSLGGASLALPFLDSFRSPRAMAAGGRPLRIVFWFQSEGAHPAQVIPSTPGDIAIGPDTELPYVLSAFEAAKTERLTVLAPPPHLIDSYSWYDKPTVGMSWTPNNHPGSQVFEQEGHHLHQCLTSSRERDPQRASDPFAGTSIDHVLGDHIRSAFGTPRSSLYLGIWPDPDGSSSDGTRLSYREGVRQDPYKDPQVAFDSVFSSVVTPNPTAGPSAADVRNNRRREVASFLSDRFLAIRSEIGCEDRIHLERHLEAIHSLEQAVSMPATRVGCTAPDVEGGYTKTSGSSNSSSVPIIERNMHRMAAMTLACDISRVVVMQSGWAASTITHPWLATEYGGAGHAHLFNEGHHHISHNQDAASVAAVSDMAHADNARMLAFLQELERFPSEGGTLADDTIIIKIGDVSSPTNHAWGGHTVPMLGGAAGCMDTARILRIDGTMNQLWTNLLHWVGRTDIERFGPAWCAGPLPL